MKIKVENANQKEKWILDSIRTWTELFSQEEDGQRVFLDRRSEKGFQISRKGEGILLSYGDVPGLCRGLLSLRAKEELAPGEKMEETCVFEEFGLMLDLSRNAVLKVETLKQMMVYATCMGYRFVGLYMEDVLEVPGEPYFGYMRGRLTPEEIRELEVWAEGFGLELRPYIQTLAHMNQITRYEEYQRITDNTDILLVGEERTEKLLDHILAQVAACFQTKKINVGMDEAMLLGSGKYLERNGYVPRKEIMMRHLEVVLKLCRKYGLEPQMWGDMFMNVPEDGSVRLPEGVELCCWDYDSVEIEHYEKKLEHLSSLTDHLAFATGAWKWTGFAPHNKFSTEITKAAKEACVRKGVKSFTVTCWGDNGAEASVFSILPALYLDAGLVYESRMEQKAFELLTGYPLEEFLWIDRVNPSMDNPKHHNNASKYLLYNDPLIGTFDSLVTEEVCTSFGKAAERMKRLAKKEGRLSYLFWTQALLCELLEKKAGLGKELKEAYDAQDREALRHITEKILPDICGKLDSFYQAFQKQWEKENKPFGFEVQTIRLGGLSRRLHDTEKKLMEYLEGERPVVEELEEARLPFRYFEEDSIEKLNYNLWADIATPSAL